MDVLTTKAVKKVSYNPMGGFLLYIEYREYILRERTQYMYSECTTRLVVEPGGWVAACFVMPLGVCVEWAGGDVTRKEKLLEKQKLGNNGSNMAGKVR
jgi:hypothetical protein